MMNVWKIFAIALASVQSTGFTGAQDSPDMSLPLECHNIPARSDQLCLAATESPINAVEDIVFYKRSKEGWLTFIEARRGDIAVISVAGFSVGGKYTIITEAEEGHPSFFIYDTTAFMNPETKPRILGGVSDYFVSRIIRLDDDGNATIEYRGGLTHNDNNADCKSYDAGDCYMQLNLLKGDITSISEK